MKKIVSILLAVMMIAAIAVPSFAVDPITITEKSDPKHAEVQVKTMIPIRTTTIPKTTPLPFLLRSQFVGARRKLRPLITPLILSLSSVLSSRFRLLLKMKEK